MKRIALALALIAALALAGTAAAADPPITPNGYAGALNMANGAALPGMLNAMSRNNANGNAGMSCAVSITNGFAEPGSCH